MGWVKRSKESDVVADDAVNATHRFLRQISALYHRGRGRRPMLEEIQALVGHDLRRGGRDCVSGIGPGDIALVRIRVAVRPRKQKYDVGDIFAVPINDGLFAFGRVMHHHRLRGTLIEVFRKTSSSMRLQPSLTNSGRLFKLAFVSPIRALESWRWTILEKEPGYRLSDDDASIEFSWTAPELATGFCAIPFKGGPRRPITREEAENLPEMGLFGPEVIEAWIMAAVDATPAGWLEDEARDMTHAFLVELRALYEEQLARPPTLAELLACLEQGLMSVGREVMADLERRVVTSVRARVEDARGYPDSWV